MLYNWFFNDWYHLMPWAWAIVLLPVVAVICGGVVGAERERKEKSTGMRTLSLVCLGSCVFTMLSIDHRIADGRITAQIISGIGFLGAGAIIHGRFGVGGLTSAASIWAVAAIGMTIGIGFGTGGFALSIFVLTVLSTMARLERRYIGGCKFAKVHLMCSHNGGKTRIKIESILDEFDLLAMRITDHVVLPDQETDRITVEYCYKHRHHRQVLVRFAETEEVKTMDREGTA